MLAARLSFLAGGIVNSKVTPHSVSNQGADCFGLRRPTGVTHSGTVFGVDEGNDVFGSRRVGGDYMAAPGYPSYRRSGSGDSVGSDRDDGRQ